MRHVEWRSVQISWAPFAWAWTNQHIRITSTPSFCFSSWLKVRCPITCLNCYLDHIHRDCKPLPCKPCKAGAWYSIPIRAVHCKTGITPYSLLNIVWSNSGFFKRDIANIPTKMSLEIRDSGMGIRSWCGLAEIRVLSIASHGGRTCWAESGNVPTQEVAGPLSRWENRLRT